jgi:hypothetical protein
MSVYVCVHLRLSAVIDYLFTAEAQRTPRGAIFVCRETTTNKNYGCLAAGLEFLPNRRLPIGQKGNSLRTLRLCG